MKRCQSPIAARVPLAVLWILLVGASISAQAQDAGVTVDTTDLVGIPLEEVFPAGINQPLLISSQSEEPVDLRSFFGVNLLQNGGAESGPIVGPNQSQDEILGWGVASGTTWDGITLTRGAIRIGTYGEENSLGEVVERDIPGAPPEPGDHYFYAQDGLKGQIQTGISFDALSELIELLPNNAINIRAEGYIGGIGAFDDEISLDLYFVDSWEAYMISQVTINTREDRQGQTAFVPYAFDNVPLWRFAQGIRIAVRGADGAIFDEFSIVLEIDEEMLEEALRELEPDAPDLIVSQVNAPENAFSGRDIQVSWTVENQGSAPTDVPIWEDGIYLDEQLLKRVENLSFLAPGESYSNQIEVTLPRDVSGDAELTVRTNIDATQHESNTRNNTSESIPLHIEITPFADLQVTAITTSPTVFSGDSLTVTWTVENFGEGPTDVQSWFDSVFLSEDDALSWRFIGLGSEDIEVTDRYLGTVRRDGILQPGESYTATTTVKLPDDAFGEHTLFIYTDFNGRRDHQRGNVFEFNQEYNNWTGTTLQIILTPPPDLVVSRIEHPESLTSGAEYVIRWEVENQGPGATTVNQWQDVVYMSQDADFELDNARVLGTGWYRADGGFVEPDESYEMEALVRLPDGIEGNWYIHVHADAQGRQFEHTFDDNNIATVGPLDISRAPYPDLAVSAVHAPETGRAGESVRVSWAITNEGESATPDSRTDHIYVGSSQEFDLEDVVLIGTHQSSRPIGVGEQRTLTQMIRLPAELEGDYYLFVKANADSAFYEHPNFDQNIDNSDVMFVEAYPVVDLSVTDLQIPDTLFSGQAVEMQWTVTNLGEGRTRINNWEEQVFLTSDPGRTYDASGDLLLGSVERRQWLDGGDSYTRQQEIIIPDGLQGQYYLTVSLYGDSLSGDVNFDNNRSTSHERVPIVLSPSADLQITAASAVDSIAPGQLVTVAWTVTNQGEGTTSGNRWFDGVYLIDADADSRARQDRQLVYHEQAASLGAGEHYTVNADIRIPAHISGERNILIETDIRNDIYEHDAVDNNTYLLPLYVKQTLPADLMVTDVSIPDQGAAGEDVVVSWNVVNIGENPALGRIREGIYLVSGDSLTAESALLGIVDSEIDLEPGGMARMRKRIDVGQTFASDAEGTISTPLPGLTPGHYRAAVRTNMRNSVRETDMTNNVAFSQNDISVSLPDLQDGSAAAVTLSEGASRYYTFTIPEGEDVEFRVRGEEGAFGSTRLYVKRDAVPRANAYDAKSVIPFELNQSVLLTETRQGTYYVLVEVRDIEGEAANIEVEAQILDYGITSVSPAFGGNTGLITTRIQGARFHEESRVYLEDASGERLEAYDVHWHSRQGILARFDLNATEIGLRDMIIIGPEGEEARKTDAFEVIVGNDVGPEARLSSVTSVVRSGEDVELEITITHEGTNNAIDYFLVLQNYGYDTSSMVGGGMVTTKQLPGAPGLQSTLRDFMIFPPAVFETYGAISGNLDDITEEQVLPYYHDEYHLVTPYWILEIPPGTEHTFRITVRHSIPIGLINHFIHLIPMPESEFTRSGRIDDLPTSYGFQHILETGLYGFREGASPQQMGKTVGGIQQTPSVEQAQHELVGIVLTMIGDNDGGINSSAIIGGVSGAAIGCYISLCNPAVVGAGAQLGIGFAGFVSGLKGAAERGQEAARKTADLLRRTLPEPKQNETPEQTMWYSDGHSEVAGSYDPNDIVGPSGFGDERWIGTASAHHYKIRYENDPDFATAPAQVVRISHPLDEHADIRSFRLGNFGFGDTTFTVPENVSYFSGMLDVQDRYGLLVEVTAGIDVNKREAFWLFRSLDPANMDLPRNPLSGYLPVNDSTGIGEGFVDYTIRLAPDAQTGDEISAVAAIYFDDNPPIDTPRIFNTIDADAPVSELMVNIDPDDPLVAEISIGGQDVGAGFRDVDIYVSVDDGPFELWQRAVEPPLVLYTLEEGSVYAFRGVARDFTGNREVHTSGSDLIVSSEDSGSLATGELPKEFALGNNFPNPFNPVTTIPFDMPEAGEVTLRVYDVLGRRVMQAQMGQLSAGRHQHVLDFSRYASGLYLVELSVHVQHRTAFRSVERVMLIK